MATNSGIRNVAFSGATGQIRFGSQAMGLSKLGTVKEEIKQEKFRLIGEMVARIRSVGVAEYGDIACETTSVIWSQQILPRLPTHGGSLIEFPVVVTEKHPLIAGPYSKILDRCSIVGIEEDIENTEKTGMTKFTLSVIEVFRRGGDGKWKSLAWRPTQGSVNAQALMF